MRLCFCFHLHMSAGLAFSQLARACTHFQLFVIFLSVLFLFKPLVFTLFFASVFCYLCFTCTVCLDFCYEFCPSLFLFIKSFYSVAARIVCIYWPAACPPGFQTLALDCDSVLWLSFLFCLPVWTDYCYWWSLPVPDYDVLLFVVQPLTWYLIFARRPCVMAFLGFVCWLDCSPVSWS